MQPAASLGTLLGARSYIPNRAENGLPDEKEYARKIANLEFDKTYFYIFGEDGVSEGKQDVAEVINYYTLYPNPSNNIIDIEGDITNILSISLIDLSGKVVIHYPKGTDYLDVQSLMDGMYILLINHKNGKNEFHKIVVQ